MSLTRRTLTIALSLCPGIGSKTIARIAVRNDVLGRNPREFVAMSAPVLVEEYRLRMTVAQKWAETSASLLDKASQIEEHFDRLGIDIVTVGDEPYPDQIEELDVDPPGVLFLYGNARLLQAQTFAVMGSRKSPGAALDRLEQWAEDGVLAGEVLIAGHDTPEYQRAAVVPLRYGAPRVLVLDRGFHEAMGQDLSEEPFGAARLWRYQFDPSTDLALSAIAPDKTFHRNSNRVRDRLIAGLARRLDFVWIADGGNMEKLAIEAMKAARPVRISDLVPHARSFTLLGATVG